MSPSPSTDPAALRHHGLSSVPATVLALTSGLLLLHWRPSFLLPLTMWVAEAFGPIR